MSHEFYDKLAFILEKKGLTPAELSVKTGLHQSYFSKLKSGYIKDVTWSKALTIINALEMTPNEFINYGDEATAKGVANKTIDK